MAEFSDWLGGAPGLGIGGRGFAGEGFGMTD